MKATETLNKVRAMLGIQVKFEQAKLENGTILESETFAQGEEIFIVNEDERIPVPKGEYAMEDGKILVVEEEGIIKEIKSGEEMPEEEASAEEVEAAEEVQFATMNDLNELKAMVSELKDMMAKQELSKQEEVEQLKEELSAPAAEPLKHNPEKAEAQHQFKISANRTASTRDRVLSRISNINK